MGRLPKRKELTHKKRRMDVTSGKYETTTDDPRDSMPPPLKPDDKTMDKTLPSEDEPVEGEDGEDSDEEVDVEPLNALERECTKMRAILNANIGACHVHLVKFVSSSCESNTQ